MKLPGFIERPDLIAPDSAQRDFAAITAAQVQGALDFLQRESDDDMTWLFPELHHFCGPLLSGDLTFVCARPGGGKTTLLLNQVLHLLDEGHRLIYAGMEVNASRLRLMLTCMELGYDIAAVVRRQWHRLPTGSKSNVVRLAAEQAERWQGQLLFTEEERLTLPQLMEYGRLAEWDGYDAIVVDHLHRMDWGQRDVTERMTAGIKDMKSMAKERGIVLLCAAQLKRGGFDALEDYLVPPQSAIKQSGAAEEEAELILMCYRALTAVATEGDLQMVRRGQMKVSDVAEPGTMAVRVAKSRLDGSSRDAEVRLYVARGRLFDNQNARDSYELSLPIGATI